MLRRREQPGFPVVSRSRSDCAGFRPPNLRRIQKYIEILWCIARSCLRMTCEIRGADSDPLATDSSGMHVHFSTPISISREEVRRSAGGLPLRRELAVTTAARAAKREAREWSSAMITAKCRACGAELQFHESAAGGVKRCPKCKSAVRVRHSSASGVPKPRRREKPQDRQLTADSQ